MKGEQVLKTFDQAMAEVERMVDRLGMHVDPGIRQTVAGLMMNGVPTSASCSGHLDRAMPYPWIDIGVSEPIDEDRSHLPIEIKKLQDEFERLVADNQVYLYNTVVSIEDKRRYAIHINEHGTLGWELIVKDESKVKLEQLVLRKKVLELLGKFYNSRKPVYESMLVLGSPQNMRLISVGAIGLEREDEKTKKQRSKDFQDEMMAFGEFLCHI